MNGCWLLACLLTLPYQDPSDGLPPLPSESQTATESETQAPTQPPAEEPFPDDAAPLERPETPPQDVAATDAEDVRPPGTAESTPTGTDPAADAPISWDLASLWDRSRQTAERWRVEFLRWYEVAPVWERWIWAGIGLCGLIGLLVALERWLVLGRRRVMGGRFLSRMQRRITEGPITQQAAEEQIGKRRAPAARVARAVVARWGRPAEDLERGASLAVRDEAIRLRRRIAVLRRVATFAPLLALLVALLLVNQVLSTADASTGPTLGDFAPALPPLIVGVAMTLFFLLIHERHQARAESLITMLDRFGAQVADAVASSASSPVDQPRPIKLAAKLPPAKNATGMRIEIPEEIVRQAGGKAD